MDDKELLEIAKNIVSEDDDLLQYHDDGYIELLLKILGLMCDGQNTVLQVGPSGFTVGDRNHKRYKTDRVIFSAGHFSSLGLNVCR